MEKTNQVSLEINSMIEEFQKQNAKTTKKSKRIARKITLMLEAKFKEFRKVSVQEF